MPVDWSTAAREEPTAGWLASPLALWISRGVLAGVFLAYGASKIPYLDEFARSIHNYRLLPVPLENLLAIVLPWIEVTAAAALFVRPLVPGAAAVVGGLTIVFLAAIGSALARGLDINCGCFTLTDASATRGTLWQHFVLDLLLLAMAAHLMWESVLRSRRRAPPAI